MANANRTLAFCAILTAIGTMGCTTQAPLVAASPAAHPAEPKRGQIVPLVDHHQHIFGPDLVDPPTETLPAVTLPADLKALLRDRSAVSSKSDLSRVYTADAQALDIFFDTDFWVTGADAVFRVLDQHGRNLAFIPTSARTSGSAGYISGIVLADQQGEYDKHFTLGLRRNSQGRWRIASEAITNKVKNPFREPLDAKTLIMRLDDAGIEQATVLSTAFWLASPRRKRVADEESRVRAANDWVIEQTAPYANRLIPFCAVNPLSTYAIAEMRRCAANGRVRGIKLHFANGMIDLKNSEHLGKVRAFFASANASKMAVVVHLWPKTGPEYSRIFVEQVLSEAPAIPVQIAHLGSGPPEQFEETLAVFADSIARADPRSRNLYFDVTEIITEATPQDEAQRFAAILRRIGLNRVLFGSDTPLPRYRPPPLQAWATFRRVIPFSDSELLAVASNRAPYLH